MGADLIWYLAWLPSHPTRGAIHVLHIYRQTTLILLEAETISTITNSLSPKSPINSLFILSQKTFWKEQSTRPLPSLPESLTAMPLAKGLSPCRPSLLFRFAGESPWDSDSHASAPEIVSQLTWDEAQKSPPPRPQQPRGCWEQTRCCAEGLLVPWGLPLLAFRGSMLSGVFICMVWTISGSLDGAFLFCHSSLYLGVLQGLTSQTLLFT